MTPTLLILVRLLLQGLAVQEGADPTVRSGSQEPAAQDSKERFLERLKEEQIILDVDRREVRVKGTFLRDRASPEYPIEYVLIAEGGTRHEGLAMIHCTPSLLNACLIAIGLERATGRQYLMKEPLPSREDVLDGLEDAYRMIPPLGERVFVYVAFEEEDGSTVERPIEDFLVDGRVGEKLPLRGFLYLGSRFAEALFGTERREVFMADYERNIATFVPTQSPSENCLLDVFAIDLEPYAFADVDPSIRLPLNSKVDFIITPVLKEGTREVDVEEIEPELMLPDVRELRRRTRNPYLKEADEGWLDRIGQRGRQEYRRMVRRARNPLREIAVAVLGTAGGEEVVLDLYDSLRLDRSDDVRLAAAYALAEIGTDQAAESLITALGSRSVLVRREARFGLCLWSGEDHGTDAGEWNRWKERRFPDSTNGAAKSSDE